MMINSAEVRTDLDQKLEFALEIFRGLAPFHGGDPFFAALTNLTCSIAHLPSSPLFCDNKVVPQIRLEWSAANDSTLVAQEINSLLDTGYFSRDVDGWRCCFNIPHGRERFSLVHALAQAIGDRYRYLDTEGGEKYAQIFTDQLEKYGRPSSLEFIKILEKVVSTKGERTENIENKLRLFFSDEEVNVEFPNRIQY